jgi:hypothetical protein
VYNQKRDALCTPQNETAKSREQRSHLKITIPLLRRVSDAPTQSQVHFDAVCFGFAAAITARLALGIIFLAESILSASGVDFHSRIDNA